ncbi:hypothetical protein MMC11_000678 [Xylographa trunciseda]|nr:hypothetical protein [Xylographa trunciseda]
MAPMRIMKDGGTVLESGVEKRYKKTKTLLDVINEKSKALEEVTKTEYSLSEPIMLGDDFCGKTLKDLHPDIPAPLPDQHVRYQRHWETTTLKPFKLEVDFPVPGNQTTMDGKREVYLKL